MIMNVLIKTFGAVFFVMLLVSCAEYRGNSAVSGVPAEPEQPRASSVLPPVSSLPPNETEQKPAIDSSRPTREVIRGTGSFVGGTSRRAGSAVLSNDGDISLDFSSVDIRDVIKAVLGDLLRLNYTVDAKVQGTITIQTSQPLRKEAVLTVFTQALKMNGLALVRSGEMYSVIAAADAPRQSGRAVVDGRGASQADYGVVIVPLRFVGAAQMKPLLEPMIPSGGILQTDVGRNLLILGGTAQERSMMLEDIAMFDVDWLTGMSFALYTPKSIEASQLAKELGQIIGGKDSPINGMVRLVTLDRLNTVMAISPQAQYLDDLGGWVERLDHPGANVDQRLYVYHVQNGRSADLAAVLTKVLSPNNAQSSTNDTAKQGDETIGSVGTSPTLAVNSQRPADSSRGTMAGRSSMDDEASGKTDQGIATSGATNLNITADEVNNALVILAAPRDYAVIEAALRQLDTVPLQVFLDASVAEVTLTSDLKYGVQYFFQRGNHNVVLSNGSTSSITASFPGLSYSFSPGSNIDVILSALETVTDVHVISSPQVLVLNNQTATLQVGDQVPIATAQAVSTVTSGAPVVNSIQYHDTGVILKVTPRVNQGGMVMMDISQEVSDVAATTTSTLNSPTIQQRKLSSTVAVRDGETIALGGLIKDGKTDNKTGVPLLQDIPYLGEIFRSTENQGSRTELLVLITPHVVESLEKARDVTRELRRKLEATEVLFQKVR